MHDHSLLRTDELSFSYGAQRILDDVSLDFAVPGSVAITGSSGAGKTTLLYAMSGLEREVRGTVELLGYDLGALSVDELAELRLKYVGFVFQAADLVPELTLRQNIALPLELAGASRSATRDRVRELEDALGIADCANRRPAQVSGGQAQRCAIARAVVARPRVVFADEPTGALDRANRDVVLDLLLDQVRAIDGLLVTVTHDDGVAARFDHRVVMVDGRVGESPVVADA